MHCREFIDCVGAIDLLYYIGEIYVMLFLDYCCEGHSYGLVTVETRRECLYYMDLLICNIIAKVEEE